jgi:hypothetical protein
MPTLRYGETAERLGVHLPGAGVLFGALGREAQRDAGRRPRRRQLGQGDGRADPGPPAAGADTVHTGHPRLGRVAQRDRPGGRGQPQRPRRVQPGAFRRRRVQDQLHHRRVVDRADRRPPPGAFERGPRRGRPAFEHHGDHRTRGVGALQPQTRGAVGGQDRVRPCRVARPVAVLAPPVGAYPHLDLTSFVDQPGRAAGQHGRATHDRLEIGPRLAELVEVGDDPDRGDRIGVEGGQPAGELLHCLIVLRGAAARPPVNQPGRAGGPSRHPVRPLE